MGLFRSDLEKRIEFSKADDPIKIVSQNSVSDAIVVEGQKDLFGVGTLAPKKQKISVADSSILKFTVELKNSEKELPLMAAIKCVYFSFNSYMKLHALWPLIAEHYGTMANITKIDEHRGSADLQLETGDLPQLIDGKLYCKAWIKSVKGDEPPVDTYGFVCGKAKCLSWYNDNEKEQERLAIEWFKEQAKKWNKFL